MSVDIRTSSTGIHNYSAPDLFFFFFCSLKWGLSIPTPVRAFTSLSSPASNSLDPSITLAQCVHRGILGAEWSQQRERVAVTREPISSTLQPNQALPHKSTPPPAAHNNAAFHCLHRFNSSSLDSFHFLATTFLLLSAVVGLWRECWERPGRRRAAHNPQSGQHEVTARSVVSELCPTPDSFTVPPGAAMAAKGVSSELRLNLDLNIGPLPHLWPFAPSFLWTRSHSFSYFYISYFRFTFHPPCRDTPDGGMKSRYFCLKDLLSDRSATCILHRL